MRAASLVLWSGRGLTGALAATSLVLWLGRALTGDLAATSLVLLCSAGLGFMAGLWWSLGFAGASLVLW